MADKPPLGSIEELFNILEKAFAFEKELVVFGDRRKGPLVKSEASKKPLPMMSAEEFEETIVKAFDKAAHHWSLSPEVDRMVEWLESNEGIEFLKKEKDKNNGFFQSDLGIWWTNRREHWLDVRSKAKEEREANVKRPVETGLVSLPEKAIPEEEYKTYGGRPKKTSVEYQKDREDMAARKAIIEAEKPDLSQQGFISQVDQDRKTSQTILDRAIDLVTEQQKADTRLLVTELGTSATTADELLYQMTRMKIIEKEGNNYKVLQPPLPPEESPARNLPHTSIRSQRITDKDLETGPKELVRRPHADRREFAYRQQEIYNTYERDKLQRFYRWLEQTDDGREWIANQVHFSDGFLDTSRGKEYLNSSFGKKFLETDAGKKYTALRINDESRKQLQSISNIGRGTSSSNFPNVVDVRGEAGIVDLSEKTDSRLRDLDKEQIKNFQRLMYQKPFHETELGSLLDQAKEVIGRYVTFPEILESSGNKGITVSTLQKELELEYNQGITSDLIEKLIEDGVLGKNETDQRSFDILLTEKSPFVPKHRANAPKTLSILQKRAIIRAHESRFMPKHIDALSLGSKTRVQAFRKKLIQDFQDRYQQSGQAEAPPTQSLPYYQVVTKGSETHRIPSPTPTQFTVGDTGRLADMGGRPLPLRYTLKYEQGLPRPLSEEQMKFVLENVGKLESREFKQILKEKGMTPPTSLSRSLREKATTLPENGDVILSALTIARNTAVKVFTGDIAPIVGQVRPDVMDYRLSKVQAIFDLLRNMENGNKYFQGPQDFKKIPNPPGLRYADKGEHARFNFRHMKSAYWRKGALPQKGTDIWVSDSYITMRKFFKEIVGWSDDNLSKTMYDFSQHGAGRIQKEFLADIGLLKRTNHRWVLNHSSDVNRNPKEHYGGKYGNYGDLRHDRPQWFPADMKEGEAIVSEQNNIWPPNGDPTLAKQNALPSSPTIYYKQPWKDRQGAYTEGKSKGRSKVAQGTDIFRLVWDYEITPAAYDSFEDMKNLLTYGYGDNSGDVPPKLAHRRRNFLQEIYNTDLPHEYKNIANVLNLQIDPSSLTPSPLQIQHDNVVVLKENAEPIKIERPEGQDKLALPTDEYTDLRRLEKSEQRKQEVLLPKQARTPYTTQEAETLKQKMIEKVRNAQKTQSVETDLSRRKFILGQSQKGSPSLPDPKNVQQPMKPAAEPAPKMPSLRSAQPVRPLTEGGQRSGRPVPPVPGTGKPTTPTGGGSGGSWFSNRKRPKYQEGGFITF